VQIEPGAADWPKSSAQTPLSPQRNATLRHGNEKICAWNSTDGILKDTRSAELIAIDGLPAHRKAVKSDVDLETFGLFKPGKSDHSRGIQNRKNRAFNAATDSLIFLCRYTETFFAIKGNAVKHSCSRIRKNSGVRQKTSPKSHDFGYGKPPLSSKKNASQRCIQGRFRSIAQMLCRHRRTV
jgi:hypothetical protein